VGQEGAVFGSLRKECTSVFDDIYVCVCFKVGVPKGFRFALCQRDECVGRGPCAYIDF
jgi:hypothetical protein